MQVTLPTGHRKRHDDAGRIREDSSPGLGEFHPVSWKWGGASAFGRGYAMQMRLLELYQAGPEAVIIFSHHASSVP